jgi:chemotaxis protein MotB
MAKKKEEAKKGLPPWLATYSDLVTLLLCFFVLLFAFAKTEEHKLQVMLGSLRKAFGGYTAPVPVLGRSPENRNTPIEGKTAEVPMTFGGDGLLDKLAPDRTADFIAEKMSDKINELGLDHQIEVRLSEDGVMIRADEDVLFSEESAVLKESSLAFLFRISQLARATNFNIAVQGHTDNTAPRPSSEFESNWDLSAQRAINVIKYLESVGVDQSKLRAEAYGPTRAIASNETASGRAKNRRVEFFFSGMTR